MFLIISYIDKEQKDTITLVQNMDGEPATFDTKEKAEKFAKEDCAFNYKIVEI